MGGTGLNTFYGRVVCGKGKLKLGPQVGGNAMDGVGRNRKKGKEKRKTGKQEEVEEEMRRGLGKRGLFVLVPRKKEVEDATSSEATARHRFLSLST